MIRTKRYRKMALLIVVVMIVALFAPLLTSCGVYDKAMEQFSETEELAHKVVEGGEVTLDSTIKKDSTSAGDMITNGNGETVYYDTKSGSYVTGAQYKANSFADSLKKVWMPTVIISFVFGFLLRRFVHSSAAIRRFALIFELAIPILMTILVYVVCGMADSSAVDFFDRFF